MRDVLAIGAGLSVGGTVAGCPEVSDVRALVEAVEAMVVALAERRAGTRPFERGRRPRGAFGIVTYNRDDGQSFNENYAAFRAACMH